MTKTKKPKKPSPAKAVPTPSSVHLPQTRKVFISHPDNLVTRTTEQGILETVDVATGNVICQSTSPFLANAIAQGTPIENLLPRGFVEMEIDGKTVIFDQGINTDSMGNNYSLSPVMRDLIFDDIVNGGSLASVGKKRGRPPYTLLCKHYIKDEAFRNMVDAAKKFRAEHLYDRIMDNANRLELGDMNKAEVDGMTSATNFLKWGCEVSNGEVYGNKKADSQGITIVVSTGIDRSQSAATIDVVLNKDKVENG